MQTNKQLELAFDFVQYTGQNIFLTGKAGTGKTTFLKSLKERSPKRMIVVAPTGVAAINAGGVTIHSFFQLSFAPQVGMEEDPNRQMRFNKEKINIIRSLDLLVIDEISMVRADILDAIDKVMCRFKNKRKPFGGAQLLMIGDLQQLSPVVKREEWELLKREYETAYFFSCKALKETPYVSIELTHVFRQQDDKFISILNKVRDNILDKNAQEELNLRYNPRFVPGDEEGYITLCTHNAQAHRMNDSELKELPSKAKLFTAHVEGNFPEYSFPTDYELHLKIGAQVMFVKNDPEPEKRFFNGKIGQVTSIGENSVFVQCPGEENEIEVTSLLWENVKYSIDKKTAEIKEELEGSFSQIPLKLAWAITIHKSQGLTFERAIIDAEASFAHGQVYVALSRCKTLEGLVLKTPIREHSIISDKTVGGFIQQVEENQPGETELNKAKLAFQREQLSELFRFYRAVYLVNSIGKIMEENPGSFTDIFVGDFRKMRNGLRNQLADVGDKFQQQIDKYLRQEPNVEKNSELLERIKKAADYFSEKVQEVLLDGIEQVDWDIDNSTVKKKIKQRVNDLAGEAKIKLAVLAVCRNQFSVKEIMEARARAMIESSGVKPKKQKAREILNYGDIPHPELYQELREWRTVTAAGQNIPAYMVFSQKSLVELVTYLPSGEAQLQLINGLGKRKIEQYGADILEIIQNYCAENNVKRGEIPLQQKPKAEKMPKIDTKRVSLELFQAGKSIDEIANERGLAETTIAGHLAHFVRQNELDVALFLDKEKVEKIVQYFKHTDNRNLTPAREALGEAFSYADLRMGLSYFETISD
ncbi:helix-turn-helix domain-containing protein [Maribellus maritimus]|uniref:helix-turn-helix domain-containing protein n=1 Tax=Maribellus maritimus TaxID=2870838 RepID=UPI00293EAA33|nr:helix-turn-helix domain-containing protein [Maribellus maritimus]MCG6185984.1 helix-turn-helix domain-containing protein [Maribellus maritimus]